MLLPCEVPRSENDSVMETKRKHEPLLKVTEILLENFMYRIRSQLVNSLKSFIVLKVLPLIIRN